MGTAVYFDEAKYDGSQPYGGVPLRNIPDEEWEQIPEHVKASALALPYFRKTNPSPVRRAHTPDKPADEPKET